MVYKRNYLWLFGVLLSTLFMASCSDEHEALQSTDQPSTVVQASVSAFKVDGKILLSPEKTRLTIYRHACSRTA